MRTELERAWPVQKVGQWSYERVLDSFKDKRRKTYERAYANLRITGPHPAHFRLKAFIKAEKTDPNKKINPDPRVIQARSPEANLAVARWLRPLEHLVYRLLDEHGLPVFAKRAGVFERARVIRAKWDAIGPDCCCVSFDMSRFDQHHSFQHLLLEHWFYREKCPDPEFAELLKNQLVNRGSTRSGLRYQLKGGRMSGDMNTALGNCLMMYGMVTAVLRQLISRWAIYDDGDDCLVFLPHGDLGRLQGSAVALFHQMGHIAKLENVANSIPQIMFCQSHPSVGADGPVMVRDPHKVLSQGAAGCRHWNNPRLIGPMCLAVGSCELALNRGIPIIQSYALALKRIGRGHNVLRGLDVDPGLRIRLKQSLRLDDEQLGAVYDCLPAEVTQASRFAFQDAWNIDPWLQQAIERKLDSWNPSLQHLIVDRELDDEWHQTLHPDVMLPELL